MPITRGTRIDQNDMPKLLEQRWCALVSKCMALGEKFLEFLRRQASHRFLIQNRQVAVLIV